MSLAKFKVVGRLDMASRPSVGTVVIDRAAGLFSVRPLRRHRLYTLPLSSVAEIVVRSIIAAEVREKKAAKKAKRKAF
jgi:hypothetical protein